jgi:hypothetical protein
MRPGQNKRIRGRGGRKGPNPLTRSYESNGPDVKIRGTAQHIAEKYLQLARDAQSSGDIIMAESLLQHAEHYFRLIAAAQQQQQQAVNGYGRQSFETETELYEDDDDFVGIPDRFAPLSERLPQPAFQPQPAGGYQGQQPPQVQPHFAQPQPQPFEERPYSDNRHERQGRGERQERYDRNRGRDRGQDRPYNAEAGERPNGGYDRPRDNRRFQPRGEPAAVESQPVAEPPVNGLPSFITGPAPVAVRAAEPEAPRPIEAERAGRESEPVGYHLNTRRRRRPRAAVEAAGGAEEAPQTGELPLTE